MHLMCENGNVWAACSDGIEIWSNGGSLLGAILVPGKFERSTSEIFFCAPEYANMAFSDRWCHELLSRAR